MKILIDTQLPPGLKLMLAEAGHDAHQVIDVGLRDAADAQVWGYAVREGIAILTDEDFAAYVSRTARPSFDSGSETARTPLRHGGRRLCWLR